MIDLDGVSVTYHDAPGPTLRDVDLHVPEGELCLVVGRTGSGKSTLLGTVSGLVPHFTGGLLEGTVRVAGRDTATHPPRELADVVGVVSQDPLSGFVTDVVEEELAYAMEQLAVPADVMRRRVEEVLDLLGLAELRARPLRDLSGGQQQRVAIASVLTAGPRILVLDEPTSALDPTAAEEVLAAVTRLVHDLGITVLLAEHRLERVVQYADRAVWVPGDGSVRSGTPDEVLAVAAVAPPVVELGEVAGWQPVPRSVRDARRHAPELRERLATAPAPTRGRQLPPTGGTPALSARRIVVRYGPVLAVRGIDLDLAGGEVTALMGRNGAGKSSLLWALQGAGPRAGGSVAVTVDGQVRDPAELPGRDARRVVGLVPQTPSDLLYLATVAEELAAADQEADAAAGTARGLLDRLTPGIDDASHPRDLSEGQRLALVLAIQLAAAPRVILLDEPTRGLDYDAKRAFTRTVRELAADGRTVVVATHDVELVAAAADRVVIAAEGEVVVDGPTAEVVVASPAFAPQVAKVLQPAPWLTVDEVADALGATLWRRRADADREVAP
ncbi:energy-coupling factor ABC transporter ATP-binding protein [Nitriliruptoraceae bacterium ZYF776]|nr:energy-coupling factor ABC transporter ATP-binding protein [Profundirhabdus halotolerans]